MSKREINIEHLANLAQLQLTDEERSAVGQDLARIMDMVDQMQAMDTDSVAPLAHPLGDRAWLRPDQVTEQVDRERYQQGAPSVEDGLYLVPRVVE